MLLFKFLIVFVFLMQSYLLTYVFFLGKMAREHYQVDIARHRSTANALIITNAILVVIILLLEYIARSEQYFIAPFTPLFIVHLVSVLVYLISLIRMRWKTTGLIDPKKHKRIAYRYLAPSYSIMLLTGAVLLYQV